MSDHTPAQRDPLVGVQDGGKFTIPKRRSAAACAVAHFVVNLGGEYCFMPGLRALRWVADLDT